VSEFGISQPVRLQEGHRFPAGAGLRRTGQGAA